MLSHAKHVMAQYMTLLMRMPINNPSFEKAKMNFNLFLSCVGYVGACYHISLV
jgi:hypothetical protein